MKQILWALLQLVLFLVVFLAGSLLPSLHVLPMWTVRAGATHVFVLDGLLAMLALCVLILAIQTAMHRLRTAGRATSVAFVLALVLGLLMKFGFLTVGGSSAHAVLTGYKGSTNFLCKNALENTR